VTLAEPTRAERLRGVQPWRRLFHASNALAVVFVPPALGLGRWAVVGILAVLLVGMFAFDVARLRSPELNALFFRMFPSLASDRERTKPASSSWYALGLIVVLSLFDRAIAVPAILVLGLADPAASTVGRIWGRRRIGKGTWLGTTVFVTVAFLVMHLAGHLWPGRALAAALITAAVEILPWGVDDNLSVPIAAASALWLVGR
jgi:diacylglycerol kinase (CTP)